jgi:hypothetical protein
MVKHKELKELSLRTDWSWSRWSMLRSRFWGGEKCEFDNTYYDSNGKFLFSAAGKGLAKRIGQIAYNTKAGKAVYDGVARLSNAIVDEYKAVFTEQGKIDRINNQTLSS